MFETLDAYLRKYILQYKLDFLKRIQILVVRFTQTLDLIRPVNLLETEQPSTINKFSEL